MRLVESACISNFPSCNVKEGEVKIGPMLSSIVIRTTGLQPHTVTQNKKPGPSLYSPTMVQPTLGLSLLTPAISNMPNMSGSPIVNASLNISTTSSQNVNHDTTTASSLPQRLRNYSRQSKSTSTTTTDSNNILSPMRLRPDRLLKRILSQP